MLKYADELCVNVYLKLLSTIRIVSVRLFCCVSRQSVSWLCGLRQYDVSLSSHRRVSLATVHVSTRAETVSLLPTLSPSGHTQHKCYSFTTDKCLHAEYDSELRAMNPQTHENCIVIMKCITSWTKTNPIMKRRQKQRILMIVWFLI